MKYEKLPESAAETPNAGCGKYSGGNNCLIACWKFARLQKK